MYKMYRMQHTLYPNGDNINSAQRDSKNLRFCGDVRYPGLTLCLLTGWERKYM